MLKIAVCDDNEEMPDYPGEIISENIVCHFKEFEVQKYLSGNDFLSEHNKSPFDIVFLDIKMPDMNGFEVAKRIRLLSEKTYIVFITTESGLVYDAFDYRPFWFIPKENSDILKSKIASVISKLKNHISDNRPIRIPLSYNDCKYVMPDNIIYIAFWFLYSALFIKGRTVNKLLSAVISSAVLISVSNLITGVFSLILKSDLDNIYSGHSIYRVLCVLIALIVKLYLFSLILKFADKTILSMNKKEWTLVITVFLTSIFSLAMIHISLNNADYSGLSALMLMLSEAGLILLNMICLYITISLNKSNKAAEELKLHEQQLMHNIRYAETVRKQYEEIRAMRHDMKQHFEVIDRLCAAENYAKVRESISEYAGLLDKIDIFTDVGNDIVNAILNSKLSTAKSLGITVICSSSGSLDGINTYDICSLLGNMLDNAIEAAKMTNPACIEVSIFPDDYKINICVSNSICRSVLNDNKNLITTKSDFQNHGIGVKTICSIADKYNGNAFFYEENMNFFCRVILQKSTV